MTQEQMDTLASKQTSAGVTTPHPVADIVQRLLMERNRPFATSIVVYEGSRGVERRVMYRGDARLGATRD